MPTAREPDRLLQAARLYYLQNHSQAEVAELMGTSRSNVSRMLTEALRLGIVEITVRDPSGRATELEDQLKGSFGLTEVRVAQRRADASDRSRIAAVGALSANLLTENIADGMTVGMSWGQTLQAMVGAVSSQREINVRFVPLVGGMSAVSNEITCQELVRELASRTGGTYQVLFAPATFRSRAARDALLAEPSIALALEAARQVDMAFVGIGATALGSSAKVLESMGLTPAEAAQIVAMRPVGDVLARFFDSEGRELIGITDDRVLGTTIAELKNIPRVIGVAAGRAKAPAVLGAVRGQIIDALVCDEALARSVLAAGKKGTTP